MIAKLNAYGFSLKALKLMHNYLSRRNQRTRINESYSLWQQILFRELQGSLVGPFSLFSVTLSLLSEL